MSSSAFLSLLLASSDKKTMTDGGIGARRQVKLFFS